MPRNPLRRPSVLGLTARGMGSALDSSARAISGNVTAYGAPSIQDRMAAAESQPTIAPPHGNITVHMSEPKPAHDTLPDQPQRRSVKLKDATEEKPEVAPDVANPLSPAYQSPALIPTKAKP